MLKTLMKSIREYKRPSILAASFMVLEVVMEVLIPYFMADIIDKGVYAGNMSEIVKFGLIMVLAALLSLTAGMFSGKFAADASAGFATNLRKDIYFNIQNFSFGNIDKFSTASLVTRMTTDVTNVQQAYQMIIRIAVRAPVMLVVALGMAFSVNWKIALIFLVAVPVLGVGLIFIATKAHPYFERVFRRYDKLNSVVQENVTAVRVVKAYVREDHEKEKFGEISEDVYQQFRKAERIVAYNSPLMQFVMYSCMLLICYFAAKFIVAGSMSTGELMSMMVYASQILNSLMMFSMVYVMIIISRTSSERIVEVLNEESTLKNPEDPVTEVEDGSVEFDGVRFSYTGGEDKTVLHDLNFSVRSGQTVGIIGGTGSAKSTLVSLIPRLYDVTGGCVRIGGKDVREYDIVSLRDQVSVVLQKNVLFSGTIKDNLRWGNRDATDEQIVHACRLAQADSFVESFPNGYDTYIEQGGTNVSGGQKQRLCIARALLKKPKILILDDSTSAVDTKTDALIRKAFREEIPDTTKFIIAQRVASVEDADLVIVLDESRIDGIGSPAELLETNEIYREIYDTQVGGAAK